MIHYHNFNRDRVCEHCGMSEIEASMVRSRICGMHDAARQEWEAMQDYHLTRITHELGQDTPHAPQ